MRMRDPLYEVAEHRNKCERLSQHEQTRIDSHSIVREQWKKDGLWNDSWGLAPGWRWPGEQPLPEIDLEPILEEVLALGTSRSRKEQTSRVRKQATPKDSRARNGSEQTLHAVYPGVQKHKSSPRRSPRFSQLSQ